MTTKILALSALVLTAPLVAQKISNPAVVFLGKAVADPAIVKQYTNDEQKLHFSSGDIAELEFYLAHFGTAGIPSSLTDLLSAPASATRIGGSATVLAAM